MNGFSHGSRALAMAGLAGAVLVFASIAGAAHPVKGATYSGDITESPNSFPISFKVTSDGKHVTKFSLPSGYPVYCQGGGFGDPKSKTAKVSKKGKFKAKLPLIFAPTQQNQGNLVITGKFGKHGAESGKAITDFKTSQTCNGTSKYTASASG